MDADEVIDLLNERAEEFCTWLFPHGKKSGAYFEIGNIQGDAGDSLRVHIAGDKVGVWGEYGEGEKTGGATLVHLLMAKRATTNWARSLCDCKEWLGLSLEPDEDRAFREQHRNRGKFQTPANSYTALDERGPVLRYLVEDRCLSEAVLKRYRVMQHKRNAEICFAQFDASGTGLAFAKYVGITRKADGKKIEWSDPPGAKPGLWGKHAVDPEASEVVITEGEIDALSVAELGYEAVSMPTGANYDGWIERDWNWLTKFRSVILCYDQDKAGADGLDRAFPKLISRIGRHRCRIARLPEDIKDPNDALQKDQSGELAAAICAAESLDPATLSHLSKYREATREVIYPPDGEPPGHPLPWTARLRLRPTEVTLWTGYNGHGKTTALLHCLLHLSRIQGDRIVVASMEAPVKKSAAILCRQACGYDLGRYPDIFEKVYSSVEENFWMYDYLGTAPWRDLLETFRYAHRRYGVSQFVIDSVMACDIDTDDYNQQSVFIGALVAFAEETGGHVHLVAHSKKPQRANEMDAPGKYEVAGHANLTNRIFNGLTVHRNLEKIEAVKDAIDGQDPDAIRLAKEMHDAELVCWKQRETGELFRIQLWFHTASKQFWPSPNPVGRTYYKTTHL